MQSKLQNGTVTEPAESVPLLSNRETASKSMKKISAKIAAFFDDSIHRKFVYIFCWLLLTGYIAGVTNAVTDNQAIRLYGKTDYAMVWYPQI